MTAFPTEDERAALRRLLAAADAGAAALWQQLPRHPQSGRFFEPVQRAGLDEIELALLLVALAARLGGRAALSGSDLVARSCPDSARRLEALGRLATDGRLVRAGLLLPDAAGLDAGEVQAGCWRISDRMLRRAVEVFTPSDRSAHPDPPRAYRTNAEVLGDLRRLSLLYRRRAAAAFHLDPWTGTGIEVTDGAGALRDTARAGAARVAERLRLSAAAPIPLLELAAEHHLDLDQLVILVTVLFQELVEGVGAVDAVDLVKLVSEDEMDLIRRRSVLRVLARRKLLRLEGAYGHKDLTADASLPNAVIARMLGETDPIDSDERIDFHAYLAGLDSSDPFFLDLGRESDDG